MSAGTDSTAEGSAISLPKGGGAISGLGEAFSADLFTGTGSFTVPIAVPAGRLGVQPALSLKYSTGNGNGPFGTGWQLGLPGVTRKTSRGIPRYIDETDVFLLSGAEDLVPVSGQFPGRVRYRPRTEGAFARIAHVRDATGDFWEVRGRDGMLTRYDTVAADPADPGRVFGWRISESRDTLGNLVRYEYLRDAGSEPGHRWDQPLLSRISYVDYGDPAAPSFLVTVDFEYEDRPDPFSDYRAGFENRTTLRCTTIRVNTHASDGVTRAAREYRFSYEQAPFSGASLLSRVDVVGIDGDATEALPPLTFGYTGFDPAARRFAAVTGADLPPGILSDPRFALVDVRGAGLPDVVQLGAAPRIWRNIGDGRFAIASRLTSAPPFGLGDPGVQLLDADGDGRPDLLVGAVTRGAQSAGYFPMTFGGGWSSRSFQSYRQAPSVSLADPAVKFIDLDGDGLTDVLRSGTRLECWFNDPDPRLAWTRTAVSNGTGPTVDLSDPSVRLADMTGDGLQDIVLIRSGNIAYWPNLGYGRWGQRVTMHDSPRLPDGYDPHKVLLGDVDGDGVADLVYVDQRRVLLWGNQSGNGWSQPVTVPGTPEVTGTDAVQLADLHGTGMAGLLFSRTTDRTGRPYLRFLDFTGGVKPHLLAAVDNHLGALTTVDYRPSTQDYLRDASDPATRWRTPLPFPVQVVAKVTSTDRFSGGRLTVEYRYHHGYWDGVEREFRGFAMVEHFDTEVFAGDEHFSPPTMTRSWFHPGPVAAAQAGDWTELDLSDGYSTVDTPLLSRPPDQATLLASLPRDERRTALRAMRGHLLRSELYALDGTDRASRPYTVTETVVGVRQEVPGVFFPFTIGERTTQWERGTEPMTRFSFPASYDAYGFATVLVDVPVPRGRDPLSTGEPFPASYTNTEYARRDDADHYLVDRVCRTWHYEVVNDGSVTVTDLLATVLAGAPLLPDGGTTDDGGDGPGGPGGERSNTRPDVLPVPLPPTVALRPIGHTRTYFDGADFEGLALGQLGEHGLSTRVESLAFTDGFLDTPPVYLVPGTPVAWTAEYPAEFRTMLPPLAGYVHYGQNDVPGSPGGYYFTASRHRYSTRGLVLASLDPLGAQSQVEYDAHDMLPVRATDALGLSMTAENDYRVLHPHSVTDVNGNTSVVAFSPLALVTAVFVRGQHGEGDLRVPSVLMEYDVSAFTDRGEPASVRTIKRAHHDTATDFPPEELAAVLVSVEFSDGFGRLLQSRTQAEDTLYGDPAFGGGVIPVDQSAPVVPSEPRTREPDDPDNVVVSGWQVYDNKGQVVHKYEPFFSFGYDYAQPGDAELGQRVTMFYDPRGHVLRTVHPDGSEQRVVFGVPTDLTDPDTYTPTPWETYAYDPNDNAGRTHAATAGAYQSHWNTPSSAELDALGRTVRTVVRNGSDPADWYESQSLYDIQDNLVSVQDALGRPALAYEYDLLHRRWRMNSLDGGTGVHVIDVFGNPVESRDGRGALVLTGYGLMHRMTRVWARSGAALPVTLRQRIEYGDGGTPEQPATDRNSARGHNLLGRVQRHYDEAGLVTTFDVDFKGNLLSNARRVIADDAVLASYANGPTNGWQVTPFEVDWTPPDGTTRAQHEAALLETTAYRTDNNYDALNRLTVRVLPGDVENGRRAIRPTFNRAGTLDRVTLDDTVYVDRIAYDAKGHRTLVSYGNGLLTRYAYDPLTFRLARLRTERGSQVLQDHGYGYDLAGNLLLLRDRTPGGGLPGGPDALDRRFEYDPIYRLTLATGRETDTAPDGPPWTDVPRGTDITRTRAYTETYGYNPVGSLLRLGHAATTGYTREFSVDPATNRLRRMTVGTTPYDYTYDANGNLVSETTTRHFAWNHGDELTAFATQTPGAEPSVHAQYLYDATGQRVKKLVRRQGGAVTVTHYLGGHFEHVRWSATAAAPAGANNAVHLMDGEQRVALVRVGPAHPDDQGPAVAFHLADHIGSSTAVVDGAGTLTNREEYTPFGDTSFGSYTRKRYRYTGKERDEESGLNYHGARYLSPVLARWLSVDPLASNHAESPYVYAGNRPTVLVDSTGKDEHTTSVAIVAHVGHESIVTTTDHDFGGFVSGFFTGGRGPNANRRYDSLTSDQTWARDMMDRSWGCTLCHVTTEVWNKFGPAGVNPANNLPWDGAIDAVGFRRWTAVSAISRGFVEAGLGAATMTQGMFGPTVAAEADATHNFQVGDHYNTFWNVPGAKFVKPTKAEAEMFRRSVRERKEFVEVHYSDGSKLGPYPGKRKQSEVVGHAHDIAKTKHTHPTSKVALPSDVDMDMVRKAPFPGDTVHEVLGDKWPNTRNALVDMGQAPPPIEPIKFQATTAQMRAAAKNKLNKIEIRRPQSGK